MKQPSISYILAGDIGGTKTLLQICAAGHASAPVIQKSYRSSDYAELAEMLDEFLREAGAPKITSACLALPGSICGRAATLTNLPWVVDADAIGARFSIARVNLINDFEAVGWGIAELQSTDLLTLQTGSPQTRGVRLVVGAGTGLGVGWLTCEDAEKNPPEYTAHPSEGGHMDFAPNDDIQSELLRYLQQRHGHVSYERLVSGPGLVAIFEFLRDSGRASPSAKLLKEVAGDDAAAAIAQVAQQGNEPIARMALDLFVSIYGAFVGNLALVTLPRGGIYVAGGIAAKIAPTMQHGAFLQVFHDKGRFADLLKTLPLHIVLNQQVGLLGANAAAQKLC